MTISPRAARAALLLEVVLALTIFGGAAMAILALVGQATGSLMAVRDRQKGADLACSALAKIEAGLESPESLNGPVPAWRDESDVSFEDGPPTPSGWELEVRTSQTEFGRLTLVEVTAFRAQEGGGSDSRSAAYSVKQLVRLAPDQGSGGVGEKDKISEEAERGARERPRGVRREEGGRP